MLIFFRPTDVIVFMVGGITFEEAATVAEFNKTNSNIRIILGGTHIHNTKSFLSDLSTTKKS
jgi:vacuolar protein sorting-associated protein 45